MQLYVSERHEPLSGATWNEGLARRAIEQIAADAEREFTADGLWQIHPSDRSPERPPDSMKPLYHGAAGVIWALHHLAENGAVTLKRDYLPAARELIERNREDLRKYEGLRQYMGRENASYMLGETGLMLLHWKLAPSDELARQLHASIASNLGDPRGLAWGAPGTMLAALFMHQRTGESRWRELFLRHFDALWNEWKFDDELRCHLWTHDLYGVTEKRLGALHGLASAAFPIIRGRHLLPPERSAESSRRIREALRVTALHDADFVNWPNNVGSTTRPAPLPLFVQHCNGAPGIINCVAELPGDSRGDFDSLLLRAGELIWHAGPLVKFPSLCHGAPGSGYAFLKMYARTADGVWLDRARRFAMHAIDQCDRALAKFGQRKYSLWTGDLGLAVYLWDCIRGTARLPTMDVF
ncbi:MAG TPA: LanC-like protein [Candidatus Acidoferrales bacterium]|nr:LanC-like protein [Candidatus Acidoferrales bacterium]